MSLVQLKCIIFGVDLQGNLQVLFGIQGDDEMKARKLKSGSWRCQVYSHTEQIQQPDGSTKERRVYKSFTCKDPSQNGKRKCEQMAAQWALERESITREEISLRDACRHYLDDREHLLSPSTLRGYNSLVKNMFPELMDLMLYDLTQEQIQRAVNRCCINHNSKTVRNQHGLLTAVLGAYRPDFAVRTALPKKARPHLNLPSNDDIRRILDYVKDTEMEIPILLAAFGPMRRSEICALDSNHIKGNTVHVEFAMVQNTECQWVIKRPKSYAGDRFITYPDYVIQKMKGIKGRIVNLNPQTVSLRFDRILHQCGVDHFRFHDLRHYSASALHALGIPDSYIMQRGGWGNDATLKAVYRHVMEEKEREMNDTANRFFSDLCNTKCNTELKNP